MPQHLYGDQKIVDFRSSGYAGSGKLLYPLTQVKLYFRTGIRRLPPIVQMCCLPVLVQPITYKHLQ